MKAFLALKYHEGTADKELIDTISAALAALNISTVNMARDVEQFGQAQIPTNKKLMPDYAFPAMKDCDLFIVEFSQKGVGLGIGAGYAYALGLPIFVLAKSNSEISETMADLATKIEFYDDLSELPSAIIKMMEGSF